MSNTFKLNFTFVKAVVLSLAVLLPMLCSAQDKSMPLIDVKASYEQQVSLPIKPARAAVMLPDAPGFNASPVASVSSVVVVPASAPLLCGQPLHAYLMEAFGPGAFIGAAVTAGFDQAHPLKATHAGDGVSQAHGTVPEWGQGFGGYSKRYADKFGQGFLNTTSRYALGAILREDVTYHRCTCTGVGPRAAHALGQAFIAHTRNGRGVPSLSAVASPLVASEAAVAGWYPGRFGSSDVLRMSVPLLIGVPLRTLISEFTRTN